METILTRIGLIIVILIAAFASWNFTLAIFEIILGADHHINNQIQHAQEQADKEAAKFQEGYDKGCRDTRKLFSVDITESKNN
jgi:hypothetical protein